MTPGKIEQPKKRKMGNNVDFSDDSGVPMDGIEIDSSMADSNTPNANQSAAAATTTTLSGDAANSTTTTDSLKVQQGSLISNGGDQPAGPAEAVATAGTASNNEALANNSPVLSFYDESKGNYSPDFGGSNLCDQSCNNPSMEDLSDPQPAPGPTNTLPQQASVASTLEKQQQQPKKPANQVQQPQALPPSNHSEASGRLFSMSDRHASESSGPSKIVRGFGELFDDDDLD